MIQFYRRQLAILTLLCAATAMVSTAAAATLKIMPLGDSITFGAGAPGAYRLPLYNLLTTAGYDFRFVGSLDTNGAATLPAAQSYHEGHIGYMIQKTTRPVGAVAPYVRNGLLEHVDTWLTDADPDIVLLMIGANDINNAYDCADAPNRLNTLISTITNAKPNAKLIVAQLTPITDGPYSVAATDALVQTYNAGVAQVVATQKAASKHVSLVDMHTPLNTTTDSFDGLHPSQSGYDKMARVWFDGIQAAVATPEPSSSTMLILGILGLSGYIWQKRR